MTKVEFRPERRPLAAGMPCSSSSRPGGPRANPPASLVALTAYVVFFTLPVFLESLTTFIIAPELVKRLDSP